MKELICCCYSLLFLVAIAANLPIFSYQDNFQEQGESLDTDINDCHPPSFSQQGRVACLRKRNRHYTYCNGTCKRGYEFAGGLQMIVLKCDTTAGIWTPKEEFPTCIEKTSGLKSQKGVQICQPPKFSTYGALVCVKKKNQYYSYCNGTCRKGYTFPDGTPLITLRCNPQNGKWSPMSQFPVCITPRRRPTQEVPLDFQRRTTRGNRRLVTYGQQRKTQRRYRTARPTQRPQTRPVLPAMRQKPSGLLYKSLNQRTNINAPSRSRQKSTTTSIDDEEPTIYTRGTTEDHIITVGKTSLNTPQKPADSAEEVISKDYEEVYSSEAPKEYDDTFASGLESSEQNKTNTSYPIGNYDNDTFQMFYDFQL